MTFRLVVVACLSSVAEQDNVLENLWLLNFFCLFQS